ncbi:FAD-dependent oxidoreductase [Streptomyces olivaceus]|uniref:NAD(P)/FAD-dependent oxidoreductase n=1 Tax=Streptomyces olivaceus TaxID=47716 RepID=UPI001CCF5955|nr:FAD-dependent oxidoreductase [Streptomyces olivaceus]MBZ6254099.1 FAD-dependent oxidoreductase [Streptomyces olivaceus]
MQEIVVAGGGFAGIWSAAGAVRAAREAGAADGVRVTLVSGGDDLVIRPRLYEQEPENKRVSLDRVLGPIGVHRKTATVTSIDTEAHTIGGVARDGAELTLSYDKLILATGSKAIPPSFPGSEDLFDVDTLSAAAALEHHLAGLSRRPPVEGLYTAVVVGAGFTGLEIATVLGERLHAVAERGGQAEAPRVVLVDRADVLGPELGPGPRGHLERAVSELEIEQRLGRTVASMTPRALTLSDGEVIPASTVIWTAGMAASSLTVQIPGQRDRLSRLIVDQYLQVEGVPDVYAAGDTAAAPTGDGHETMQSCQHALPMGKFAGHNVVAALLGTTPLPFTPDPYTTCLDLGAAGAVYTEGWERTVVSSGAQAKELKQNINTLWIYPPLDASDQLLAQAGRFTNG